MKLFVRCHLLLDHGFANISHVFAIHDTTEREVFDRVHQLLFYRVQSLLVYREVEYGIALVAMKEQHTLSVCVQTVMSNGFSFSLPVLVRVHLPGIFRHNPVCISPVLIISVCSRVVLGCYIYVDDRFEHVCPKLNDITAHLYVHATVFQTEPLFKAFFGGSGREVNPYSSVFKDRIPFIKRTTSTEVED